MRTGVIEMTVPEETAEFSVSYEVLKHHWRCNALSWVILEDSFQRYSIYLVLYPFPAHGMNHLHARHDQFMCVAWLIHTARHDSFKYVTCLICMSTMTRSCVWYGSFIFVTQKIHTCGMTHSHAWHDSFTWVTWLYRMHVMNHLHVQHDSFNYAV